MRTTLRVCNVLQATEERIELRGEHAKDGTCYDLVGPADAPCVVLIHGLGLCREIWQPYINAFAAHYRVLNYDLYGHGDSAPPSVTASLSVYAQQIHGLLADTGVEKAALVGFSIGGMINRRFALDYPEYVRALVILNSPHERGKTLQQQVEARAATVRDLGAMATMESALERWFTASARQQQPNIVAKVVTWRKRVDPESYAQAAWVLAAGVKELVRPDVPINVPSLVLTCANDTGSTPAMSHAIAAEIPGAETIIVPELQHLGLMEITEPFCQPTLNFLQRTL